LLKIELHDGVLTDEKLNICNKQLSELMNNKDIPPSLKNEINDWESVSGKGKFEKIVNICQKYMDEQSNSKEGFHIQHLFKICENKIKKEVATSKINQSILKAYIQRIHKLDAKVALDMCKYCDKDNFYQVMKILENHTNSDLLNKLTFKSKSLNLSMTKKFILILIYILNLEIIVGFSTLFL